MGFRTAFRMADDSRTAWEGRLKSVRVTYAKLKASELYPEYRRTRETRWEDGGTILQA